MEGNKKRLIKEKAEDEEGMYIGVVYLKEPPKPVHVILKKQLDNTVRLKVKEGLLEMGFLNLEYKLIDDKSEDDDNEHQTQSGKKEVTYHISSKSIYSEIFTKYICLYIT